MLEIPKKCFPPPNEESLYKWTYVNVQSKWMLLKMWLSQYV